MVWHGFWVLPTASASAHPSADCAAPRVARCKVPFPDAPVPRGRSRTQAVPLLCSSASVALVCIWLSAPVSSCSPPHCCWAQQLSPRCRSSGMGHHRPALHHQEWWRRPNEVVRLLEHTEQQTWLQPSRQEACRGRKSYCCSHTPAITSQQKAASAQPGESPRTGTARVTFTGRAADRPEP